MVGCFIVLFIFNSMSDDNPRWFSYVCAQWLNQWHRQMSCPFPFIKTPCDEQINFGDVVCPGDVDVLGCTFLHFVSFRCLGCCHGGGNGWYIPSILNPNAIADWLPFGGLHHGFWWSEGKGREGKGGGKDGRKEGRRSCTFVKIYNLETLAWQVGEKPIGCFYFTGCLAFRRRKTCPYFCFRTLISK